MYMYTILICLPLLAFCQDFVSHQVFRRFDVDHDGNIEPREIGEYFRRFDTNNDNRISREEYRREVDTHHLNNPQAHRALLALFDDIDQGNDNFLDRSDFDFLFDEADRNRNNLVNEDEFVNYFHSLTVGPILG